MEYHRLSKLRPKSTHLRVQDMRRIVIPFLVIGSLVYATSAWDATISQNVQITVSSGGSSLLPPDRDASANWKMAGLLSVGGIPNRTTQCGTTINPIGGG